MDWRTRPLRALGERTFDVVVVGGGITGCGIARDAVLRGLSVALIEKDDFASGTSSRSSRLIHGGVRYLEHGHLHLVFESSAERRRLLRLAPHLVRPLRFTWPVFTGARIPRWKLGAGLMLYDMLALFGNVGRHRRLSRRGVLALEPALRADDLLGGASYYDAATNDARLTLANAVAASEAGAAVLNHAMVIEQSANAVVIEDRLSNRRVSVATKVIVDATGPWASSVRGSKGAHIAVPRDRLGNSQALTLLSPTDGRVLFALPAGPHAIVGTTDTYTDASPDRVHASNDDVRYLIDAANSFFPRANLSPNDVVSAWAGIRPLLPATGATPGAASREHAITTDARGIISIGGGKLTTYRVMAGDVMKVVLARLGVRAGIDKTKTLPLPGGDIASLDDAIAAAARATGDPALAAHLARNYGSRWTAVWKEIQADGGRDMLLDDPPYTVGEMRHAVRDEMACSLGDLLIRRTHLAFETRDHGVAAAERLIAMLGWSSKALADYADEVDRVFTIG
jgi:glycerol-3-phosphate dehydrogenase